MQGWIKLHRSLKGSAIASHPEYLAVWIHLLVRASHSRHEMVVGRTVVTLEPGQLVFGRKKFSAETGVSENKVRAALEVLKKLKQITIKSRAKFSIISIIKWADYQEDHQQITSNPPAPHQHPATNKNGKNEKNEGSSQASRKITFDAWLEQIREAGEKPIPDDHSIIQWAQDAGIPHEFLAVCWEHFKDRYSGDPKKYIDWRKVFGNAVRENWFKIWWHDGEGYRLTTIGQQGMNALNSKQRKSA